MSSHSRSIVEESSGSVVTKQHRETYSEPSGHFVSSLVVNLRQLHTDLHKQHQHDKGALNELNKSFQIFVNRVHQLQSQNEKYRVAIADHRRHASGLSNYDVQWDEGYFLMKRDATAMGHAVVDYEWDFELCQLQIGIYKQLINIESQGDSKKIAQLDNEAKKMASDLMSIRSAYGEMQRRVEGLYVECDDLFKQYLTLTNDWCIVKKQRNKGHLSMETLKSSIAFYKSIQSYTGQDYSASAHQSTVQVETLDLEKIKRKIRKDFENFYATIYREMTALYESKMVELETDIKQTLHYQSAEIEEFSMRLQTQQSEYEKVQKSLYHEREMLNKLEATYAKLEGEYKAIQFQYEERFDAQEVELHNAQESIMVVAFDVDEIRRSKADLEAEIIVYRNILNIYEIEQKAVIVPQTHTQTGGSEMMGKLVVKSQRKGSIAIKECAPNGTYISLVNHSGSKDIDLSRWKLKRHLDSETKLRYTIPDGVRIQRGSELRIYAKSASGSAGGSSTYDRLVNNDLNSWGMGTSIETLLFNKNGDEEASYLQIIKF